MELYNYDPFTLPTIDFIGGSTQELAFHVYFHNKNNPFDLSRCTANFSVVSFTNKNGAPLISKTMRVCPGDADPEGYLIDNILRVTLTPADTLYLVGKFIYQISVKENTGRTEVPSQGIFYITNNINKSYFS